MLINYYEDGSAAPVRLSRPMIALMAMNGVFSSAILFAWTYIAFFVAEPLSWATWMPISRGFGFTGVLDYPFVMLWALPLVGVFGAWISIHAGRKPLAYAFVAVPLVMLALVMGWFHLAPPDWR
jgi:hypothetical protein